MLLFWFLCVWIAIHAYKNGDPIRLTQIYDVDGNPCGMEGTDTEEFKFAYFYQPLKSFGKAVCVKSCPSW